jgi:hypothetical protein
MLVKQRDLLELHKPLKNKDKLKEHDLRVSEAAGALFGDRPNLMSARYRLYTADVTSTGTYSPCLLHDCVMCEILVLSFQTAQYHNQNLESLSVRTVQSSLRALSQLVCCVKNIGIVLSPDVTC